MEVSYTVLWVSAFTVWRYEGKVSYRHTIGDLWGGLRAVLGMLLIRFCKETWNTKIKENL